MNENTTAIIYFAESLIEKLSEQVDMLKAALEADDVEAAHDFSEGLCYWQERWTKPIREAMYRLELDILDRREETV
jgi:hypothetical protein